jgi:glycerol-3-phosphate dehydrogenase
MYDVTIIGCGIVGSAIAYELSKKKLKCLVLEKENDVAMGATRANSAIIHAGYDPDEGTLMAKLNVRGAYLCEKLCEDLSVAYKRIGALVLAFSDEDVLTIKKLYKRGVSNGVEGLEILSHDETKAIEPNISDDVKASLYAPTTAIINPWEYALALAETAAINGVEIMLDNEVTDIKKMSGGFALTAGGKEFLTRYVINAAGAEADAVHDMALPHSFNIVPNKGAYYLLDKNEGARVNHVIFQCPSKAGKGVLVSPTIHGNLIVGPNSVDSEPDDTTAGADDLYFVRSVAVKSIPSIDFRANIRNFSGVRPNSDRDDFIIEAHGGFFDVAGIKSPGLASAPGIAEYVISLMEESGAVFRPKESYVSSRKQVRFNEMSHEERAVLVKDNPLYGRVICRCETVTEGEIIDAIRSPIMPRTVGAVKRRCGAGLGRCQGGFCEPRVLEILARELKVPIESLEKEKSGSYIVKRRED